MFWPFRRKPKPLNPTYREAEVECRYEMYAETHPAIVHVKLHRSGGVVHARWDLVSIDGEPVEHRATRECVIGETLLGTDDPLTEALEEVFASIRRYQHIRASHSRFALVGRWKWLPVSYKPAGPAEPPAPDADETDSP